MNLLLLLFDVDCHGDLHMTCVIQSEESSMSFSSLFEAENDLTCFAAVTVVHLSYPFAVITDNRYSGLQSWEESHATLRFRCSIRQ